jgi:hypothetical protein
MPDEKSNGKQPPPPESLHFERRAVKCQRCKRDFAHFILEEIDDLVQLRCGDVLIDRAELSCLHCGWIFYWSIKKKDFEKMVLSYGQILVKIGMYVAE